jgi:hypothetical protein
MNRENPNAPHPDETFWSLEVEILPGKLEAFRAVVRETLMRRSSEPSSWIAFLRRVALRVSLSTGRRTRRPGHCSTTTTRPTSRR